MRKTTAGARLLHQQLLLVRSRAATEASNFFTQMHQLHTVPTTTTNLTALFSSLPPPPAESHSQLGASSIVTMSRDSILDPIFDKKRALRTQVRKQLNAIIPTQRTEQDVAIQDVVLESLWFKSSERLCAYISCGALREVDTSKILSEVLHDQGKEDHAHIRKKLYVPRVDDKNNYMSMLNISSTEDLIANSMIILEPSSVDCDGNQREDGLAFDRSGRRLGRSGG